MPDKKMAKEMKDLQEAYVVLENTIFLRNRAMDHLMEGVTISNPHLPDNPLIYVNPAFLQLTGYAMEEVIGRNARFLQGERTSRKTVEKVRSAIAQQQSITVNILNYRKDGKAFWNQMMISPVFDENNILTNFVGIQRDVTSIREMENKIRKMEEQLSRKK